MRITHSELDLCLADPSAWVSSKLDPSGGGPRPGYNSCLLGGIYHFHKTSDVEAGHEKIRKLFSSYKLTNLTRQDETLLRYNAYIQWYYESGLTVAVQRIRIERDFGNSLILGGIVSRIDVTPEGYRAVLLGSVPPNWQDQIRMPLIQRILAETFGRPESEFFVGWQEPDGSCLDTHIYSGPEIDDAWGTVSGLSVIIKEFIDTL